MPKHKDCPSVDKKSSNQRASVNMGIFSDLTGMDSMIYGSNPDEDAELEAELMALQQDSPKKTAVISSGNMSQSSSMQAVASLDKMIADSMRDDDGDDDVNISADEESDLMEELNGLTNTPTPDPPTPSPPACADYKALLNDRLDNYQQAHMIAKANNETSKTKRLDRGIKTLNDLLRKVHCGRQIDEDDIPPMVAKGTINTPSPAPTGCGMHSPPPQSIPSPIPSTCSTTSGSSISSPTPSQSSVRTISSVPDTLLPEDAETYKMLIGRRDQYKQAAMEAKKSTNLALAKKHMKTAKSFEPVMQALVDGKPIDLNNMPPPLSGPGSSPVKRAVELNRRQGSPQKAPSSSSMSGSISASSSTNDLGDEIPEMTVDVKQKLFHAPEKADSVLDALEQRLNKYRGSADEAKAQGNCSKAKRMARITKQFEVAIKDFKAGKTVDFLELPTPPGFPPIPTGPPSPKKQAHPESPQKSAPVASPTPNLTPTPPSSAEPPAERERKISPRTQMQRQSSMMSKTEQNAAFLQDRQHQYKKAALTAKRNGDLELAKKYVRMAKGFDKMIIAAQSGFPVDMSQVPPHPGGEPDQKFEDFVMTDGPANTELGDRNEAYEKLRQDLIQQIRTCSTNAEHFTKLGDVSATSKFDKLVVDARKDLDSLENAYKHGDPVPRFHYEKKTYSLVKSFAELGDDTLELCIIRGINYGLPSGYNPGDMDTYIKYELPYPSDEPQKGTIDSCKGTNSPEYNKTVHLDVKRKSRSFLRVLRNKAMKLDIYYKRGIFKSDKLLGSVSVKMISLENICELHDTYNIMDGRKTVGGKLELRMRIRDPFVGKQVDQVTEKWLVLDHFDRKLQPAKAAPKPSVTKEKAPAPQVASIEVMKYEKQLLEKQMTQLKSRMSDSQLTTLKHQGAILTQRIEQQKATNTEGGQKALAQYASNIEKLQNTYLQDAQGLVKQGNREKAQKQLQKKKLIEHEVEQIRSKLQQK